MTSNKWMGGTAAGLVVCLALAGCGTSQTNSEVATNNETSPTAPTATTTAPAAIGATVQVKLNEFNIEMPKTVKIGMTTFNVTNTGTVEHNFEIEGQGIEKDFEMNLKPGQSKMLTVDLKSGVYEVYCPVGKHEDKGMKMELTVTD